MTEIALFHSLLWGFVGVAAVTFLVLFFITAPYGRHARAGWGPQINATVGWIVMEAPSPLVFLACFLLGDRRDPASIAFLVLWQAHYLHRAFVFPFRRRGGAPRMPLFVAAMAIFFNVINGYLNGRWLYHFGPVLDATWLLDPRFLAGVALFAAGYAINQHSDHVLFNLRRPGETGYKIPRGGFYRYITCPNYFGEIVEWSGFALLSWSPAAAVFVLWTIANLLPRARAHHQWYRERFPDYPPERRALLPLLY